MGINIFPNGEKTEQLTCNWCKLPHPVEPDYKKEVLERGKKAIEESELDISPEETWTCGKCYLYLVHYPENSIKTECDHDVPKIRNNV